MKPLFLYSLIVVALLATMLNAWRLSTCRELPAVLHSSAQSDPQLPDDGYYDIGDFEQPASTDSKLAQRWFDRGMAMCIAFNHEEAIRCFERALKQDSSMAMAYWGLAYAMGPNINNVETPDHVIAQARFALQMARLYSDNCSKTEKALIRALEHRYPVPVRAIGNRSKSDQQYASALYELMNENSNSALVHMLYAESLMMLQPWQHYDKQGNPSEHTPEILRVLEMALKKWPNHPGLCHLYIHTLEAGPNPSQALDVADRLGGLMPGAGHLVHMPSHIYALVGDYEKVIQANAKAIELDNEFAEREGSENFYLLYRVHNYHFLVYGAMFDGQRDLAMKTARELVRQIPESMLKNQTDFLDAFVAMPLHVMIRFGMWEEILEAPSPGDELPMSSAIWRYARAIAYAATGQVELAEREQQRFLVARKRVPETSVLFNNTSLDILDVADQMVAGEIEYRKGNYEKAFKHLRRAVELDDALNYDEPWGWMQPARHALGALLLEQNRFSEAQSVYRKDLEKRPNNPWALRGLIDCLKAQKLDDELAVLQRAFDKATQRSDINIDRSCFCKQRD